MKIKEIVGIFLLLVCGVVFISYYSFTKKVSHQAGPFEADHPHIHDLIHQQNDTIFSLTNMLRSSGGNSRQNMVDLTNAIKGASGQIEDDKSRTISELDAEIVRLRQKLTETNDKHIAALNANVNERDRTTVRDMNLALGTLQEEVVTLKGQLLASGTKLLETESKCGTNSGCSTAASMGATDMSGAMSSSYLYADDGRSDFIQSDLERDCSERYGRGLLNRWKSAKQEWCTAAGTDSTPGGIPPSSLTCYPYHQQHKKLDGRPPDLFCEGRNIAIDFSKVSGSITAHGKPPKGAQYLQFREGNTVANCKKTAAFKDNLFMPHQKLQMGRGGFSTSAAAVRVDEVVEKSTYLLARDEDCENTFHSTADFMNLFFVMSLLRTEVSAQQVLLWDKYSDGPYAELIQKAFSRGTPKLRRHSVFGSKVVLFKHVVWHLESPAGLIFPRVANPDPMRCHSTGLFTAYRKYVLQSFGLFNQLPPTVPSITVSLRRRTSAKNVGRVIGNEAAVESVLREGNMISYQMVDFGTMSFGEQLKAIRSTNILVGVHGAGLMYIMFAAEESVLIEIHPSYRQDRHFRHAARMTGKVYMPVRSQTRETCVGSSDTVTVPIDEFRKALDGAVRMARSFDDGLSECGLTCPPSILALDKRLDGYYGKKRLSETQVSIYVTPYAVFLPGNRGQPQNTRFPCN